MFGVSAATIGQLAASGLIAGCIYALIAIGFNVLYKSMGMLNFAQGEFVILGGFLFLSLSGVGIPLLPAVAGALAGVGLVGFLVEYLVMRRTRAEGLIGRGVATIGVSLFAVAVTSVIWGVNPLRVRPFSAGPPIHLGQVVISRQQAWIVVLSLAAVIALHLFFTRTQSGIAMRAASLNAAAARGVGISVQRVNVTAWVLSALVAGLAGILVTPITGVAFGMGLIFTLKGIAAAILGGMGSMVGAVIGGVIIGVVESMSAIFMSSGWQEAMPMLLLVLVLMIWPKGILGTGPDRV